jgi:hypothetical protein
MPELKKNDPDAARRLQAELELKVAAIKFAVDETKRSGFDPHITLKTFEHIRKDDKLRPALSRRMSSPSSFIRSEA